MNKLYLKLTVGLVALSLAVCAGFFSIVGLSKLFAGAAFAVIAMAATLEASKLIIASFLYQHWAAVSKSLRAYLLIAITIIAMITSIGIYGFLSGAYQTTKSKYDLTQTQTDSLKSVQSYYESALATCNLQLNTKTKQLTNLTEIRNSQELRATQLITLNRSTKSSDKSAAQTEKQINQLSQSIDELNSKIVLYGDSASKVKVAVTQVSLRNEISSELGTLVYLSNVTGWSMDKIVNILIILFIIVFDPLAICMVLAFNFLNRKNEDSVAPVLIETEPSIVEEEIIEELPTEAPLGQSETESINIDTQQQVPDNTVVESELDKRRAEKQKRRQGMYSGGISI